MEKVVNENNITVVHGDSMNMMFQLEKESFDLIILDPDYQDWDSLIDNGLIQKSLELIKDSGNILCFCKQPFDYKLRVEVEPWFRRELVWTFCNGGAWVSKKMPLVSFQKIYWLTKSKDFYFNERTGTPYNEKTREFKRSEKVFGGWLGEGKQFSKSEDGIWLRDHLHYNKPSTKAIPSKPEELIRILLKCFCPSNGSVLDPFSGYGTVPVLCKTHGYNCIAYEIDKDRCNQIIQRVGQTTRQEIAKHNKTIEFHRVCESPIQQCQLRLF